MSDDYVNVRMRVLAETAKEVKRLAGQLGMSATDLVITSVRTFGIVVAAVTEGKQVYVESPTGERERLEVPQLKKVAN